MYLLAVSAYFIGFTVNITYFMKFTMTISRAATKYSRKCSIIIIIKIYHVNIMRIELKSLANIRVCTFAHRHNAYLHDPILEFRTVGFSLFLSSHFFSFWLNWTLSLSLCSQINTYNRWRRWWWWQWNFLRVFFCFHSIVYGQQVFGHYLNMTDSSQLSVDELSSWFWQSNTHVRDVSMCVYSADAQWSCEFINWLWDFVILTG